MLHAAFRDVHGSRLHGFALLVALGDRQSAADAASQALNEGMVRAHELRHPERAAAWLRRRVLEMLRPRSRWSRSVDVRATERLRALGPLGVDEAIYRGLAALSTMERAALVAGAVERLDELDVEGTLGLGADEARRVTHVARQRYLAAYLASPVATDADHDVSPTAQRTAERSAHETMLGTALTVRRTGPLASEPEHAPRGELGERVRQVARRALAVDGSRS